MSMWLILLFGQKSVLRKEKGFYHINKTLYKKEYNGVERCFLRLNEGGGCMSIHFYIHLLKYYWLFLCLGLMVCIFEYETQFCILTSSQFSQQLFLVWFVFRLMKDKVEELLCLLPCLSLFIIPAAWLFHQF